MRIYIIVEDNYSDQKLLAYLLEEIVTTPEIRVFNSGQLLMSWVESEYESLQTQELILFCDQHLRPESGINVIHELHQTFPKLNCFSFLMSGDHLLHHQEVIQGLAHGFIEKLGDLEQYQEALISSLAIADSLFLSREASTRV